MRFSPETWSADRLKNVAVINASSLSAGTDPDFEFEYLEISNVDYHGIVHRDAIEKLRFEDAPSRARRVVSKGCTVISSVRPNLQAIAHIHEDWPDLVCSTGFNVVQPNEHILNARFLYYVLLSDQTRQYLEATATGVGYPAVGDKDFNRLEVVLPMVPEQERIAAYLDASCAAIDAAIDSKRQQIESLEVFRSSEVMRAVTNGLHGASLKSIEQDWLSAIPKHWQVVRVKRTLERMDYGISISTEQEGQHQVLKMGNIQSGKVVFSKMEFVDDVPEELLLAYNDLLYNRTNSADQVGKAAVFKNTVSDSITFASYLVRLRVNHKVSADFLNYVLNSEGFLGFARKLAIPSVQQSNLNSTRYGRMLVPLPPMSEQLEIVEKLNALDERVCEIKSTLEKQIDTLTAYRKSLIHECVTGKRRITETDLKQVQTHGR
ncbi:MAG: hypothetical protein H6R19_1183 [Proteobacteria bacterium]|nr:hypothetical protein [Pseudomonadota bacterium]